MADLSFLDVAQQLQMKAPDAPLPYLLRCLREAAIEFCEKSESYVYRMSPVVSISGETEYELDIPQNTRIVKIWRLTYQGRSVEPTSEVLLDDEMPGWESMRGTPSRYFFSNRLLTLAPAPKETAPNAIKGSVVLKPSRGASGIDEDFFEEHEHAIYDGALKSIFSDRRQKWGDAALSGMHASLFAEAVDAAKSKALQDHTAKKRVMGYGGV